MAKRTSKKSFKSLFSKSEVSLADADKRGEEKKSFKIFKFPKKSKSESERPEDPQVLSAAEPSISAEDREAWADNVATRSKRFSLYGTSSRSKGKELSYSELDLRKTKKFSTFSFGLRKRRMKDEDGISKSTVALHHQDIEEEIHLEPSQMVLDQAKTKPMLSMSHPELDSSDKFDIPSPPPVTTNPSESPLSLFNKSQLAIPMNTQSEAKDPLKSRSDLIDAHTETKAPIATIPELQLENPVLFEEKENIPVPDNSSKSEGSNSAAAVTHTESTPDAGYQTVPFLPASLPQVRLDSSYHKTAVVESVISSNSQCDNDIHPQSRSIKEAAVAESTVTVSHQPDAPDAADSPRPNDKPSLASADSNTDATITESAAALHSDNFTPSTEDAFVPQEISLSHTERSNPESAKSVTTTSAISSGKSPRPVSQDTVYGALYQSLFPQRFPSEVKSEARDPLKNGSDLIDAPKETYAPIAIIPEVRVKENIPVHDNSSKRDSSSSASMPRTKTHPERSPDTAKSVATTSEKSPFPVNQDSVYGALYGSLFPQSFTSEVMSSLSNPPPQNCTEIRHLNTKLDPVMVTTRDECLTETNVASSLSASSDSAAGRMYDAVGGSDPGDGNNFSYSELIHSLSEVKSDSSSLIVDIVRSVPVVQISAPPIYDYATSQGTNTQVTDSIRKVILVKELVSDEVSSDTGHPSPTPEIMIPATSLEMKMESTDSPRQVDRLDGYQSPTYLSVGSDECSTLEIYYSAEEDNDETGDEERFMVDEGEEISMIDCVKEAIGLRREIQHQGEIAERDTVKSGDKEYKGLLVEIENEEGKMGREEKSGDGNGRTEVQQQLRGQSLEAQVQESGRFLVATDEKIERKEVSSSVFSHGKEEGREESKEELLATPVQQVNTPKVCDLAPPSSEWHGESDISKRNRTTALETDDHANGEKQLPGQETQHLAYEDSGSCENIHAAARNTGGRDLITPKWNEAAERGALTGESDKRGEASKEEPQNSSDRTASAVTDPSGRVEVVTSTLIHSSGVQSDAPEVGHNRALQRTEWADTVTAGTVPRQVAAELSTPNTDRPCTEAADAPSERGPERLRGAQLHPNQGSLTTLGLLLAASDAFGSADRSRKAERESADTMESVHGSVSSTRSAEGSSSPERDEPERGRAASPISEGDAAGAGQGTVDGMTSTGGESRGGSGSKYRWKNRFEGVSQYKPTGQEESSFSESLSYRRSDTNFTTPPAPPETTAYSKYHGGACSSSSSSSSSSPFQEERATPAGALTDSHGVDLSREGEPRDDWRSLSAGREEPAAPAAPAAPAGERERQRDRESEELITQRESQRRPWSGLSSAQRTSPGDGGRFQEDDGDASQFTGVFQATLVRLTPDPAAPPSTPPSSPDEDSPNQRDMDIFVDTLKSMGPALRSRTSSVRPPAPVLVSSLPPIVEDAPAAKVDATGNAAESPNGLYTLPPDLGLKRNFLRDGRSPLEMIRKNHQEQVGARDLSSPLRTSGTHNLLMRKSADSSPEDFQALNGNGGLPHGSRLDNSVIFGRTSTVDQTMENRQAHRSLFRTSSLPETGLLKDRISVSKEFELGTADPPVSRFDRFSFLLNSSPSTPNSLIGSPPPSNSPTSLLSPTGPADLHRAFTVDSPRSLFSRPHGMGAGTGRVGAPVLQRSLSDEAAVGVQQTPVFKVEHGGSPFQAQEPERNLASKYRAFPDAYLTKEKEHGKLNPRPGKMYIFDRPGMCGQRIEVRSDVSDATSWELQETISIQVIRGGWVLYEKPGFKGEKIALDEGDTELTSPFSPPEEQQQNGHNEGEEQTEGTGDVETETKPARRFVIGSLRRAVRDYSVPEISLFPEQNAEGKKVIFRDTSEDARIFGFPIKANSIIINAGLWLVYAHPFFQGTPRVLEVGGYSNPEAWGVEQPYVASLHPLKIGEPRVENMSEPKMVIYQKPYFTGKSRTITTNMRDFMTRTDQEQTALMYNVGSLKVLGGIWVGYEKDGFRGHQYLLEEGEYQDWRVWGGCDSELRSVRVIRADLTDPLMVMFEQQEEEQQDMQEVNSFEVTEAIPDVELFEYKVATSSIHVVSGAWVAYSHVDFSGNQYILEKGFYSNCADWGSHDNRICSVQPILPAPSNRLSIRNQMILYPEPNFKGECQVIDRNQEAMAEKRPTKSCKVWGGSWVIYDDNKYSGNSYVLSEGDYPNLTSMGCPPGFTLHSVKAVPMMFCIPSISLFGLECLEGREITTETEILSMVEEGFNNHILSLKVNSGCWVICEYSNYRGRQFLLEPIEIINWVKFTSLPTIGSLYPVRQKRRFFRIKNKERGHFMSVQGGVEEMKSGRVVVTSVVEPMSDIWYYQDGFIKSKLSPNMSLQVMGNREPGAKVVLWVETSQPIQTWKAQMIGLVSSLTFPGMVLDVKGGKAYDKDHVVILAEDEERPSQRWEIELL